MDNMLTSLHGLSLGETAVRVQEQEVHRMTLSAPDTLKKIFSQLQTSAAELETLDKTLDSSIVNDHSVPPMTIKEAHAIRRGTTSIRDLVSRLTEPVRGWA